MTSFETENHRVPARCEEKGERMKLREAIQKLQEFEKEVGDAEIVSLTEVDGRFCIEYGRVFDIIQLPDENDQLEAPVIAFMEPVEDSHLKIIK